MPDGFQFPGGGSGGGVIGGVIGGPIGAVIGSWVGRRLGRILRGRRSPEEFVDDMIEEGRVPEFLSSVVTRDRLIATERQSRGAGWVLDRLKERVNDAIARFDSGRVDYAISELQNEINHNGPGGIMYDIQHDTNAGLAHQLRLDIDNALISALGEAQDMQSIGEPPSPPAGGGEGSGGMGGGGFPPVTPPGERPDTGTGFSKATISVVVAIILLGVMLGRGGK